MPNPLPKHPSNLTMKAVCFSSSNFGPPSKSLSLQTIPKPFLDNTTSSANDGSIIVSPQALIKVHACGLNPIDKLRMEGGLKAVLPEEYDTSVLGYDVSGVIEEISDDYKDFKVGDEVYVRVQRSTKYGALAEYIVCNLDECGHKPSNLTHVQAAAVPLAGLTALQALRRGNVTSGSKVLIPGGAGGVGTLGIQIAKRVLGAAFVATTASEGKGMEIVKKLGADRVVDYRKEEVEDALAGEDFDMVLDTMNQAAKMAPVLKQSKSTIISISGPPTIEAIQSTQKDPTASPPLLIRFFMFLMRNRAAEKAARSKDCTWEFIFMKASGEDLDTLGGYFEKGEMEVVIDTVGNGLEDYEAPVEKLCSGRAKGKCVIKVV